MKNLKAATCPDFLKQLSNGVLKMAHMAGAAPFTCPRPWGRGGGLGVLTRCLLHRLFWITHRLLLLSD